MIIPAINQLQDDFQVLLDRTGLGGRVIRTDGSARRLVLRADGISERQADIEEVVLGPPVSAGTGAAVGFARKMGTIPEQLRREQTGKGEYFAHLRKTSGRSAEHI